MVGNIPQLVNPQENATSSDKTVAGEILYIPLEFWFCRNPGLKEEIGQKSIIPSPMRAKGWESNLVEHVLADDSKIPQMLVLCQAKSNKTKLFWKPLTENYLSTKDIGPSSTEMEATTKTCTGCNCQTSDFRPRRSICRDCERQKRRDHYANNRQSILQKAKEQYVPKVKTCKRCHTTENLCQNRRMCVTCYRQMTAELYARNKHIYAALYALNKQTRSQWYEAKLKRNAERTRRIRLMYGRKRTEKEKETHRIYSRTRYRFNMNVKIRTNLCSRLNKLIQGKGSTLMYLQCSMSFFKKWLEHNFTSEMSWSNYGSYWVIDHIKPCKAYDLSVHENVMECFCWKNLRPLSAPDNIKKSSSVDDELIKRYAILADAYQKAYVDGHGICAVEPQGTKGRHENAARLRTKLRYGKNPSDWATSSQAPKAAIDEAMEKVQRLDGFGSERSKSTSMMA